MFDTHIHMLPSIIRSSSFSPCLRTAVRFRNTYSIDYLSEGIDILTGEDEGKEISFQELGVQPALCRALAKDGITAPTHVQTLSLPNTLRTQHAPLIIQSETGSGKTLTYLLPALQDARPGLNTIIVTPTRELAVQVYHAAKNLAGNRKNSRKVSILYSGIDEERVTEEFWALRPNILVGTPKKILETISRDDREIKRRLAMVSRLVLDEGDNLLKSLTYYASPKEKRNREIHPRPARLITEKLVDSKNPRRLSLICTSATTPRHFCEELSEIGWGEEPLVLSPVTRNRVPENIKHFYIKCGRMNKMEALVMHFKESKERDKMALVFIHRHLSIDNFVEDLRSYGIEARALYKEMRDINEYGAFLKKFRSGEIEMVVGTEETVRGLDFSFVKTLYLTEVPKDPSEYLHLAGRVGRMGREGVVVTLIGGDKEEKDTIRLLRYQKRLRIQESKLLNLKY